METMTPGQLFVIVLCAVSVLIIQAFWANIDVLIAWWRTRTVKRFQDVAQEAADHYVEHAPPSPPVPARPATASEGPSSAWDAASEGEPDVGGDELVIPRCLTYAQAVELLALIEIFDNDGVPQRRSADKIATFVGKRAEEVRPLVRQIRQRELLSPVPPSEPGRMLSVNNGERQIAWDG